MIDYREKGLADRTHLAATKFTGAGGDVSGPRPRHVPL
ncbi:hypothetical protein I547_3895 [Mycobacterium kansasii 824]|nr:hypothetical protein I547_3895 [Mycobacterium kansasii 824]